MVGSKGKLLSNLSLRERTVRLNGVSERDKVHYPQQNAQSQHKARARLPFCFVFFFLSFIQSPSPHLLSLSFVLSSSDHFFLPLLLSHNHTQREKKRKKRPSHSTLKRPQQIQPSLFLLSSPSSPKAHPTCCTLR